MSRNKLESEGSSSATDALIQQIVDLILTSGGQIGIKMMIVGMGDVFLDATQLATLTPPAAITGFATSAKQDTLAELIGEVQATPTENTVLDRLKDLLTSTPLGNVAHDSADSGAPLKVGFKARTTNPTAVADADRADGFADDLGRQVVVPHQARDLCADTTITITASTSVTDLLAADANNMNDILSITLSNISATATEVLLYDDDGTTVRWCGYCPGGDMRGIVFPVPLKQTAVNKKWKAKTVTSVTSVKITIQYVKNGG